MRGFFYAPTINSPLVLLFVDGLLGGEGRRLRKRRVSMWRYWHRSEGRRALGTQQGLCAGSISRRSDGPGTETADVMPGQRLVGANVKGNTEPNKT